jgi:hypothetical protein
MPRELIATAPRTPALRDYDEPALGPTDIRIRTELASPKHGTELVGYRNDPVASRPYDPAWGAGDPTGSLYGARLVPPAAREHGGRDRHRDRSGDNPFPGW